MDNSSDQTDHPPFTVNKLSLSVVLSFRNEAEVLPELIKRLRDVLGAECSKGHLHTYELIFVNDVSTDRSEEILLAAAKEQNDIKIVNMSRNFGVAPCVLAGLTYSSGDAVVYMDADLQDPPEVIPQLIQEWQHGDEVDVVHTIRLSRDGESKLKLWLTKLGYKILRRVSSVELQIDSGDFKLLSRRVVNHLIRFREKSPFIRGLVSWIGFNQTTVYYHRAARFAGDTKFPIYSPKVIRNFLYSALISFSDIPLQLAVWLGLLASFSAFLVLGYTLIERIQGYSLSGWTALMIVVLFLGGVQLLSIGILGLYISSIFLESKNRPNYIVKNTFGFENTSDHLALDQGNNTQIVKAENEHTF